MFSVNNENKLLHISVFLKLIYAPFPYTSTIFCEENRVDMNHIGLEVNTIESLGKSPIH